VMGRRRVLGAVLSALLAMLIAMPSLGAGAQNAPVVVHLKFRLLARDVSGLTGSGRYVGYTYQSPHPQQFVLLDDQTGKRTIVNRPGCGPGVLGGPWVAFDCVPATKRFQLYNIQTRKWRRLACDAVCQQFYYVVDVRAVGARWLELSVAPHQPCGDGVHSSCGPTTYIYYNIATGKPRSARVGRTTIIDLNSPELTRRVCRPLPLPAGSVSPFPLLQAFCGSFAVAEESNGLYLERCGSRLHMPLATGPSSIGGYVGNTQAVVVFPTCIEPCTGPAGSGIFLPSVRRFTFGLPSGLAGYPPPVGYLGARHIYAFDTQDGRLWLAAFPSKPPGSG
jgi:hypothetical protein